MRKAQGSGAGRLRVRLLRAHGLTMKFVAGVILASVIAVCTAVLPAAQAPQKPAQPPQQPTFKAGVSFVSVDAYPTLNGQIVGDLKQDEFEVLEDGVPQRIETFEHVVPRPAGSPSERGEPSSQAESDEMAADPRVRLFVLFFDTLHMAGTASPTGRQRPIDYDPRTVGRALVTFLDALIGPDDLIGLMQPRTPVDTLLFTRRPSSFETFLLSGADFLKRYMEWEADDTEREYTMCYPREDPQVADVASNMIARRREVLMIDGLRSLTTHLQNLREGRKAVIVISEGWTLFKPDRTLERGLRGQMPGAPPLGIKGGQPVLGDPNALSMMQLCERDRLMLARIDNELEFRQLLQDANRANVTFYPVSPRGLTAESTFNRRSDSLTTLATATDGVSLDTSNDFAPVLKRIRDDVSSYYLLGYNSTNANFDGKFRAISVRVRRPGVTVRARPGYTAPTAAEIAARAKAAEPRDPVEDLRATALGSLGTERADRPFRIAAGYGFEAADPALRRPGLWVVGELDGAAARSMAWSGGGEATVVVGGPDGQVVATQKAAMTAATPRFSVQVSDPGLKPGDYLVSGPGERVRAGRPGSGAGAL